MQRKENEPKLAPINQDGDESKSPGAKIKTEWIQIGSMWFKGVKRDDGMIEIPNPAFGCN